MTKIRLGYVVRYEGTRSYLGGIKTPANGVHGWWFYRQPGALRMTRRLARQVVTQLRSEGYASARVVRLVKTVRDA